MPYVRNRQVPWSKFLIVSASLIKLIPRNLIKQRSARLCVASGQSSPCRCVTRIGVNNNISIVMG
jgi:hypothetical protein